MQENQGIQNIPRPLGMCALGGVPVVERGNIIITSSLAECQSAPDIREAGTYVCLLQYTLKERVEHAPLGMHTFVLFMACDGTVVGSHGNATGSQDNSWAFMAMPRALTALP